MKLPSNQSQDNSYWVLIALIHCIFFLSEEPYSHRVKKTTYGKILAIKKPTKQRTKRGKYFYQKFLRMLAYCLASHQKSIINSCTFLLLCTIQQPLCCSSLCVRSQPLNNIILFYVTHSHCRSYTNYSQVWFSY